MIFPRYIVPEKLDYLRNVLHRELAVLHHFECICLLEKVSCFRTFYDHVEEDPGQEVLEARSKQIRKRKTRVEIIS